MIRKFLYSSFAFISLLLAGCSADEPFKDSLPNADGRTTLNILVPSPTLARQTRAIDDAHADKLATEGTINNLALIGFYTETVNGVETKKHFYTELTQADGESVDDVYMSYKLKVVPANYQLYVLGNYTIDAGLLTKLKSDSTIPATQAGTTTDIEEDVKKLELNLASGEGESATYKLFSATEGLPMTYSGEANVSAGQTKQIVANLKFACAKVRVNIIYAEAFGNHESFYIEGHPTFKHTLTKTPLLGTSAGTTPQDIVNTDSKYYDIPDAFYGDGTHLKPLSDIAAIPAEGKDPLDNLGDYLTSKDKSTYTKYVWQNIAYISENITNTQTTFHLTLPTNPTGKTEYEIPLGCTTTSTETGATAASTPQLLRGHYYDLIAIVKYDGEIEFAWDVTDWKMEPLTFELAGKTSLYISQTLIKASDKVLTGEDTYQIPYSTNAPRLTFTSDKDGDIPIFNVKENKTNYTLDVSIRGDIPSTGTLENVGFYVHAGNLSKYVQFEKLDLKKFLRLMPKEQTVYTKQFANEWSFPMFFDYSTNDDELQINLTEISNSNSSKTFASTDDKVTAGIYVEIVEEQIDEAGNINYIPKTDAVALTKETAKFSGESLPKNALIRVTMVDPTNPDYYAKQITGTFTATTKTQTAQTAKFTIQPNPTVYTIHFKAKDGTNEDAWGQYIPHIYVYQPLYYNGYPVYGQSGSNKINWIEYSFTGNYAFKGWKEDGGYIDALSQSVSTFDDPAGTSITGYDLGGTWGDPGSAYCLDNNDHHRYNHTNLLGNFKGSCSVCFPDGFKVGEEMAHSFQVWPGVGMKNEGNGWYRIDLPLLAKPGMAFVMFTNGHNSSGDNFDRYPGAGIPGVPLPNYSDSEAWYLLDKSGKAWTEAGKDCKFTDDCPDEGPDPSQEDNNTQKIGIFWEKNTIDHKEICFFTNISGSNKSYWPDEYWTRENAELVANKYYVLVMSTEAELNAVNQLMTDNHCGYSIQDTDLVWWDHNKHNEETPTELSSYKFTKCYKIWK